MGMVTVIRRIDDQTLKLLLDHPMWIHRLLDEEEEGDETETMTPAPKQGLFARLFGSTASDLPPPTLSLDKSSGSEVDLDKSWNAIHFMLTGAAEDTDHLLGFICCGGSFVGDEEVGYGPARAFSSSETSRIAGAISGITREDFLKRFDAPSMVKAKVYPEQLWAPDRAAEHNELYVCENFEALRVFLIATAKAQKGFLIFLT